MFKNHTIYILDNHDEGKSYLHGANFVCAIYITINSIIFKDVTILLVCLRQLNIKSINANIYNKFDLEIYFGGGLKDPSSITGGL